MKISGIILLIISSILFITGFAMDTTVATELGGGRVHNIGLMNERQTIIIASGIFSVIGAIFIAAANRTSHDDSTDQYYPCPFCAEKIKKQASICKHCGARINPQISHPEQPERDTAMNNLKKEEVRTIIFLGTLITLYIIYSILTK